MDSLAVAFNHSLLLDSLTASPHQNLVIKATLSLGMSFKASLQNPWVP